MKDKENSTSDSLKIPSDVPESFFEIVSGLLNAIEKADISENPVETEEPAKQT